MATMRCCSANGGRGIGASNTSSLEMPGIILLAFSVAITREIINSHLVRNQVARLRGELAAEQQRQQQLRDLIDYLNSPTFQEQEARLFNEKLAEEKSKLKIKVLENEDSVLNSILKARGLVAVEPGVVEDLRAELAISQQNNAEAVESAVADVKRSAAIELNAVKANLESAHKVAIAELTANSKAKDDRIAMLTEQLEAARGDLKAERETRLEIAKADANRQGVVVNTGKN